MREGWGKFGRFSFGIGPQHIFKDFLKYLPNGLLSNTVCLCERRITNGEVVASGKKYMVYLVNSPYSENQPDAWLCGGVLISTLHVLTAAACLTEVSHIYVIAGYKKYVSGDNIMNDQCTATRKQRIVKVIIPKAYNESAWMRFDVGIGVVEKHYNFLDLSYRRVCSYEPEAIPINYDEKLEMAGNSVLALGWGAANARKPGMGAVNSEYLMEAHAITTNSSFCQQQFPTNYEYLFLCTYGLRNAKALEDVIRIKKENMELGSTSKKTTHVVQTAVNIRTTDTTTDTATDTTTDTATATATDTATTATTESINTTTLLYSTWRCGEKLFSSNNIPEECIDNYVEGEVEVLRRKALITNGSDTSLNETETIDENKSINRISRKHGIKEIFFGGICQNDHGGPLVALAGQQERLIGIALNSVYNRSYQCDGPSLYLSTARAKALIKCLLSTKDEKYYVPKRCKAMNFEVRKYNVTWPTYEEGVYETTAMVTLGPKPPPPPVSLIQPISPTALVQPKDIMTTIFNTRRIYTPAQYDMGQPLPYAPPNLMMAPPNPPPIQNLPPQYSYYKQPNYNMPVPFVYYTRPQYNLGFPYKMLNYNLGMPHIPSNLNMGLPYNPQFKLQSATRSPYS